VLDWNAPAIAFYQSLGAAIMPDWRIARVTGASLTRMAADASVAAPEQPGRPLKPAPDHPGEFT
jgi:hypothetical protein